MHAEGRKDDKSERAITLEWKRRARLLVMVLKMDGRIKNSSFFSGSRESCRHGRFPPDLKGARGRVRCGQPPLTHLHRPTGRRDKATILSSEPEKKQE